ncbi:hypothetical protein PCE1_004340 [Barthelona sp. PCE]
MSKKESKLNDEREDIFMTAPLGHALRQTLDQLLSEEKIHKETADSIRKYFVMQMAQLYDHELAETVGSNAVLQGTLEFRNCSTNDAWLGANDVKFNLGGHTQPTMPRLVCVTQRSMKRQSTTKK